MDAATADLLAALSVGQRLDFLACPDAPLAERLQLRVPGAAFDPPSGPVWGRVLRGVAAVGLDGIVRWWAPGPRAADLRALAEWAAWHLDRWPACERLAGSELVDVAPDGAGRARVADDRPWRGFPHDLPVTGGLPASRAALARVGTDARIWLGHPPAGAAVGVVVPVDDDPDGDRFVEVVRAVRGDGPSLVGRARVGRDRVAIATADDTPAQDLLREVTLHHPALRRLRGALVARIDDAGIAGSELAIPDGSPAFGAALLAELRPGRSLAFRFAESWGGEPALLLEADAGALPATGGREVTGRLRFAANGTALVFESRDRARTLLARVAAWVGRHRAAHPALDRLRGARYLVVDDAGAEVERLRDDEAWAALGAP